MRRAHFVMKKSDPQKESAEPQSGPAASVQLEAFDISHRSLFKLSLPVDEYYSNSHPLIDEDAYRVQQKIGFVTGVIFDWKGKQDQEFHNEYDEKGALLHSRTVHADGTIIDG
ncbi:hypothetical protein Pan161_43470 [Gimesia algae]|uniref:Uncharacterized protein n=2 Tax=Gimesia algae TaxID=2527971 RepID=A0A517VI59_9PLAN|nr:hypothetical protein Pan161_43470 [Gimesia algae]